ncbi:hypothetical protein [Hymenobacter jeollabukensis]|uniref:Uncharacterized protein n=1 Tax=Hymenobacter jeollabukensis TaxID=2025313 RepID=A0A5R8WTE7_9BACT|nr:hypothetical protein [Hymenobacter jeollabukensis]TLM94139.1 hypothetical protein FDY95_08960 [Hymenobacter jeollabukensis]
MQRSLSHTNPPLTRTTLLADFDSMWRGSALFSVAAGHRLDVLRGEVEERIAERQTQRLAASVPPHSESSASISDLRKQLRKPVAAPFGNHLENNCEVFSADSDRSPAPQPRVSRLVARSSGAGRLTAFWEVARIEERRKLRFTSRFPERPSFGRYSPNCQLFRSPSFNDTRTERSRYML